MRQLMSNADYHSHDAIGSTLLKKIAAKTLLHAVTEEFKGSDAMRIGSALHCKVLEPENFKRDFAILPECNRRTKEGKAIYNAFVETSGDKTILKDEQMTAVNLMSKSIMQHEIASGMLTGGEAEYSYFVERDGIALKTRPDYVNGDSIIDIKTCQDASADGFTRACIKFMYHLQAAFYLDVYNMATGKNIQDFYIVAVESSPPYAVNTFKMGEVEIDIGRGQYLAALKQYAEYLVKGSVLEYGYEKEITEIAYPIWALEKMAKEEPCQEN